MCLALGFSTAPPVTAVRLSAAVLGATAEALDGDQAGLFVHGVEDAVKARAEAVVAGRRATADAGRPGIRLQGVEGLVDSLQGAGVKRSEVFGGFRADLDVIGGAFRRFYSPVLRRRPAAGESLS
jgi:hypothetical protein